MSTLGFLAAVRGSAAIMTEAMQHHDPLVADAVFALYSSIEYSEAGSNRRRVEERIQAWWRDLVLDLEGEFIN